MDSLVKSRNDEKKKRRDEKNKYIIEEEKQEVFSRNQQLDHSPRATFSR